MTDVKRYYTHFSMLTERDKLGADAVAYVLASDYAQLEQQVRKLELELCACCERPKAEHRESIDSPTYAEIKAERDAITQQVARLQQAQLCPFFDKPTTWVEAHAAKVKECGDWCTRALQAEAQVAQLEVRVKELELIVRDVTNGFGSTPGTQFKAVDYFKRLAAEPRQEG